MRYRKSALVGAALVAFAASSLTPGQAAAPRPVADGAQWNARPEGHEFLATPEGLRYRGTYQAAVERRELVADFLRDATPEAGRLLSAGAAGSGPDRAVAAAAAGGVYPGSADHIGDVDGDGLGDVAFETYDDEAGWTMSIRSGSTGAVVWERSTNSAYLIPMQIAGRQGFLSLAYEEAQAGLLLRSTTTLTMKLAGLDGLGNTLWTRDISGTQTSGVLRAENIEMPVAEALADVRGDTSDDLVLTLRSGRYHQVGRERDRFSEAVAIVDGSSGAIIRGPHVAASRWLTTADDLDGDGKRELLEERHSSGNSSLVRLDGDANDGWVRPFDADYAFFEPEGGDLDGDGLGDLLYATVSFDCSARSCTYEAGTSAVRGVDGTVLGTWDDKFPIALGQVDDDAGAEVQLFEPIYTDEEYGFSVEVFDLAGEVNYGTAHTAPNPEEPWMPALYLDHIGDVDADAAMDQGWEFGRYQFVEDGDYGHYVYETVSTGRASAATGADLGAGPAGAWPSFATFDGDGDDYDAVAAPTRSPNVTLSTFDGRSAGPLWSTAPLHVGYWSGGWLIPGDADGDGRADMMIVAMGYPTPDGPEEPELRILLVDGATGAVKWQHLVD